MSSPDFGSVVRLPDFLPLLRGVLEVPGDNERRRQLHDFLLDAGCDEFTASEAIEPPVWSNLLPLDYYGSGSGSGSGRGRGRGRGSGSGIGSGIGVGSGSGSGIGRGRGSGRGRGRGSGIGRGRGRGSEAIMELGKAYLLETVDWFAWVGRPKRQIGPWEYEFESVSKISDTNAGDVWQKLAEGDKAARRAATYLHYKVPVILGMGAVAKILWVGKTPQEEGLPG